MQLPALAVKSLADDVPTLAFHRYVPSRSSMLFPSLSAELIKGSAVYSWGRNRHGFGACRVERGIVMAEKFDPAPADKHADTLKKPLTRRQTTS